MTQNKGTIIIQVYDLAQVLGTLQFMTFIFIRK